MYRDDRAVSITVGYVLNLAIASILISGLLVAGGGLVESQTKQVTSDELAVAGHQLADELSSADRLVRAGDVSVLSIRETIPAQTAAGSYTIQIEHEDTAGTIELRSSNPDVTVVVPFRSETSVRDVSFNGGAVLITYDNTATELVIEAQ